MIAIIGTGEIGLREVITSTGSISVNTDTTDLSEITISETQIIETRESLIIERIDDVVIKAPQEDYDYVPEKLEEIKEGWHNPRKTKLPNKPLKHRIDLKIRNQLPYKVRKD
jgi:hypothetical protein